MSWHVYLLRCNDGSFYCGITKDLSRRILEHNGQRPGGARYTATRRPVSLLDSCERASRSEALKLEALIKKLPRNRKQQAISHYTNAGS